MHISVVNVWWLNKKVFEVALETLNEVLEENGHEKVCAEEK